MAPTIDRWLSGPTLLAWVLLVTTLMSVTACDPVDCTNIATTGCGGVSMRAYYDPYDYRPSRD